MLKRRLLVLVSDGPGFSDKVLRGIDDEKDDPFGRSPSACRWSSQETFETAFQVFHPQ